MDVQMPVMNGYDATRAIRRSTHELAKTIPIIAMTANAFSEDIQYSLAAGMNAHISKPVDMKTLEKTIRRIKIGGRGTETQAIEQWQMDIKSRKTYLTEAACRVLSEKMIPRQVLFFVRKVEKINVQNSWNLQPSFYILKRTLQIMLEQHL